MGLTQTVWPAYTLGFEVLICSLWLGKDSDKMMLTGAEVKRNHMASGERAAGRER